jgi:hypothetical protein
MSEENAEGTTITENEDDLQIGGQPVDEMSLDEMAAQINAMTQESSTQQEDPFAPGAPTTPTEAPVEEVAPMQDAGEAAALKAELDVWKKRFNDRQATIDRQGKELGEARARLSAAEQQEMLDGMTAPAQEAPAAQPTQGLDPQKVKEYIDSRLNPVQAQSENMNNLVNFMTQYPSDWQKRLTIMQRLSASDERVGKLMNVDPSVAFDYVMAKIDAHNAKEGRASAQSAEGQEANAQAKLSAVIAGGGGSTADTLAPRMPTEEQLRNMTSDEILKIAPKSDWDPLR